MDNRAVRAWRRIVAVEKPKLNPIWPMLAVLNGLQCPSENDRCLAAEVFVEIFRQFDI